ncbi:hypothetical protein SAMN03159341_12445 [Paenibacillus sp. 1_12]|uniref:hypothetical protein n=1 Tax=Paenibacillus sp. 1_12 TaxID=1566278 RepID=UPI0008EFE8EC|nr:hypothetical protein [Paenibacillus sp. 1_12]SFM28847.1 hypothetical protein SAMN03159341_12445 [Paenibacillus sp. 1_12]
MINRLAIRYFAWAQILADLVLRAPQLIKEYSSQYTGLTSQDLGTTLVIRQPATLPRAMEIFIHNPEGKVNKYRRIQLETDATIYLNEKVVPLQALINNKSCGKRGLTSYQLLRRIQVELSILILIFKSS